MMCREPKDFSSSLARARVPSGEASSTIIISQSRLLVKRVSNELEGKINGREIEVRRGKGGCGHTLL